MANTIKLKRASGSDPSASDLAVGELAIRTSNCKLFSKNDGGSAIGIVAGSADTLTTARTIAGVSFDGSANISLNNNAITNGAGYLANIVSDTSPQLGGDLDVQASKITTATSNGNIKLEPDGTGVVEVRGAGGNDGKLQLNCSAQSHGIKLASPAHSAGQSYTFIFPDNQIAADKYLKVKSISGSGSTATGQLEYASLDANDLGEGTVPDARFPSTLPALNGSALTNLNGSNIASGTIAAARVATLNQDTTGNAATATALETARTIAGVSFDGTANISLNNNAITNGAGYITDVVSDTSPQLGGTLDTNNQLISFGDSTGSTVNRLNFGAGNDLNIYHDGSDSYLRDSGTGQLQIWSNTTNILNSAGNEYCARFKENAEVELYFNNVMKLETESAGISVVGEGKFAGIVYPSANNSYNLGTTTNKWANVYATTLHGDGSNLTGISAGATGGGSDQIFYENGQTVTTNYTITNGKNAMSAGPITINSGVTVTVGAGETYTIV